MTTHRAILVTKCQLQRILDGLCFDCAEPAQVGVYCLKCHDEWAEVAERARERETPYV